MYTGYDNDWPVKWSAAFVGSLAATKKRNPTCTVSFLNDLPKRSCDDERRCESLSRV